MSHQVLKGTWEEVRARDSELTGRRVTLIVDDPESADTASRADRDLSVRELLKLSLEERDRILLVNAPDAEITYRSNPALTDFESFGNEDMFDETP